MRDINIAKCRKILGYLQNSCSIQKNQLYQFYHEDEHGNSHGANLTDFERGIVAGKHAAYNHVIKEIHYMIKNADKIWNTTTCREERRE